MKNITVRYLLIIFLLILTATLVNALQYDSSQDDTAEFTMLQEIPMQIGDWQGRDLPLDDSVYNILETRNIIHRNYTNTEGDTILLSIVYYNDTKVDFHAPEACLGGRGERTSKTVKRLNLKIGTQSFPLEVAEIISTNPDRYGVSYYFYKAGNFMGQNYIKMRLNLARNSLFSGDKSGALIRFSGNYWNENDRQKMERLMQSLIQKIIPAIIG